MQTRRLLSGAALTFPLLLAAHASAQTATQPSPAITGAGATTPSPTGAMATAAAEATTPAVSPQPAGQSSATVGEIVVTALKRATNLEKTPAKIDVVSGSALQQQGVTNLTTISSYAPAVDFGQANGVCTTVTIRGVSSQDTTELGDPAVAISIDGEYIERPLDLAASLFDVNRVEVLRGPQGTLYGRNATAGAINILTNEPTQNWSGSLSGAAGNYNAYDLQGYINVPVNDMLAFRLLRHIRSAHGLRAGHGRARLR